MSYLAAIVSGILASLSFPTIFGGITFPDLFWLVWFALIPFFLSLFSARLVKVALLTCLFGIFWNGLTSYWIFNALYFNGQLGWVASLGVLAFMAFGLATLQSALITAAVALARRFSLPWLLMLPGGWTFYEWIRNYFPFGGYPWSNLGYTQAKSWTLLQSADLFGVYGITFLIVLVNLALAQMLRSLRLRRPLPWFSLSVAGLMLIGFLAYGRFRTPLSEKFIKSSPVLAVGLLQPNIGQHLKWKKDLNEYIQDLLIQMTRRASQEGADFVLWPETALPTALPLDLQEFGPLSSFKVPVLLGILSMEAVKGRSQPILYNSALQVAPGGKFFGRLHKQHLVPLGEYVPLQSLLWFVEPVVPKIGDFRISPPKKLLEVHGHPYGVLICYEDLFPEISRKFTRMGADFLVNITNDAWYGDSSQLDQHLHFSIFRAVENRRSLIRGTNTGYTAAIDPTGRIHAEIPKFIKGVLITEIPLNSELSIYTRWGNLPWIGLLVLSFGIAFIFARRKRPPQSLSA